MEPISVIAAAAITILIPYFQEVGKGFAKKAGESAWEKCEDLYQALIKKFKGKPSAEEALSDLKNNPTDEDNQASLRKELRKFLEVDKVFAEELSRLIDDAQKAGIFVSGSGAVATSGGTAAGANGIAIHGNVDGGINIGANKEQNK